MSFSCMSFRAKMYVQLAGELIACSKNPSFEEAYLRSSVSRSYYGVFLVARSLAERNRGSSIPNRGTHTIVREHYLLSSDRTDQKIGRALTNLMLERKQADYESGDAFDEARASTAHAQATKTLNRLINRGASC